MVDTTTHANNTTEQGEISAFENSGRLSASAYAGATMYTTLSPCEMCTGACVLYKVKRVVVGENVTFMGAEEYLKSWGIEVVILDNEECKQIMRKFIEEQPDLWYATSLLFYQCVNCTCPCQPLLSVDTSLSCQLLIFDIGMKILAYKMVYLETSSYLARFTVHQKNDYGNENDYQGMILIDLPSTDTAICSAVLSHSTCGN